MPTYKAITTRIMPATRTLPTRIKTAAHGRKPFVFSKWSFGDYGDTALHAQAAEEARKRWGWTQGQWAAGEVEPGTMVHVRVV